MQPRSSALSTASGSRRRGGRRPCGQSTIPCRAPNSWPSRNGQPGQDVRRHRTLSRGGVAPKCRCRDISPIRGERCNDGTGQARVGSRAGGFGDGDGGFELGELRAATGAGSLHGDALGICPAKAREAGEEKAASSVFQPQFAGEAARGPVAPDFALVGAWPDGKRRLGADGAGPGALPFQTAGAGRVRAGGRAFQIPRSIRRKPKKAPSPGRE